MNNLIKCGDCGSEFEKSKGTCPECGARNPESDTIFKKLFVILAVVLTLGIIISLSSKSFL